MGVASVADSTGLVLVGLGAFAAIAWGALLSVRSARRGPSWALAHVRRAVPVLAALAMAGLASTLVLRPRWVGASLTYAAVVVWVLAVALRRTLARVEREIGFGQVPVDRRGWLLARARWVYFIAGGIVAIMATVAGGTARWVGIGLAGFLVGTGWAIARRA